MMIVTKLRKAVICSKLTKPLFENPQDVAEVAAHIDLEAAAVCPMVAPLVVELKWRDSLQMVSRASTTRDGHNHMFQMMKSAWNMRLTRNTQM